VAILPLYSSYGVNLSKTAIFSDKSAFVNQWIEFWRDKTRTSTLLADHIRLFRHGSRVWRTTDRITMALSRFAIASCLKLSQKSICRKCNREQDTYAVILKCERIVTDTIRVSHYAFTLQSSNLYSSISKYFVRSGDGVSHVHMQCIVERDHAAPKTRLFDLEETSLLTKLFDTAWQPAQRSTGRIERVQCMWSC